jgi:hypothetical protein
MLATSTTEAELISAASCSQDVAFCRKLANGIGVMQTMPTVLREDNNGCLSFEFGSARKASHTLGETGEGDT